MELETGNQKFLDIAIDISPGFPFTIDKGSDRERRYNSLTEMINPDDIPPITEMFTDVSGGERKKLEVHCRFKVNGDYHWFYISCDPVYSDYGKAVRFEGKMGDVSTYIESAGEDLVYKQFRKKGFAKISELRQNEIVLSDVLEQGYLSEMLIPFTKSGLYSAITTPEGRVICATDPQYERQEVQYQFVRKKTIRINHQTSGHWIIAAKTEELLSQNTMLWETLFSTVSRMANAIVVVMTEIENSQNANKMLGQNVEEQILLNNIYAIIMESRTAKESLEKVVSLVGEYFKLDRISIIELAELKKEIFIWKKDKQDSRTLTSAITIRAEDYPNILRDLNELSSSFSDDETNDLEQAGVKSYAVFKLFDAGEFDSLLAYETLDEKHNWTQREKKQLKNIAQIISSIIMQMKVQEKLEQSQDKLRQLAFYDAIYNIPNRTKLNRDMGTLLRKGESGSIIAFKVTNTRNLSAVNGHTYSDMLLRNVAQYLEKLPVKNLGVYYFTNAIFMLNLPGCIGDEPKRLVEMLIHKFSKPWKFGGDELNINCSLGIAYYPLNGKSSEEICKAASIAMYRAREFKRNSYTFYSGNLEKTRTLAATLEERIKDSIDNGMKGFSLKFQPTFSADDGRVIYCESLVRWTDEKFGNIPNSTLFPLLENLGLSSLIDGWVLEQSCLFCKQIQQGGNKDFRISVNLTASEIQSSSIVSQVKKALGVSGLSASSLILEIPVKANVSYNDSTHILTDLKAVGISVAIDSYGTEDISLKMLKNSYVDIINIPCVLLSEKDEEFDRVLINSIIELAHCKDIKVCIKGIEDESMLRAASDHDIDWVQGYYCSKPLWSDEAAKILIGSLRKTL
ncbi:MAG: EAL domain-containing protein [Ruminiclostridium sp.]|nr:EAL domain-containing protein [Ruminiclostridium sp.]